MSINNHTESEWIGKAVISVIFFIYSLLSSPVCNVSISSMEFWISAGPSLAWGLFACLTLQDTKDKITGYFSISLAICCIFILTAG